MKPTLTALFIGIALSLSAQEADYLKDVTSVESLTAAYYDVSLVQLVK